MSPKHATVRIKQKFDEQGVGLGGIPMSCPSAERALTDVQVLWYLRTYEG